MNKNSLLYWYPHLVDQVPTPKTVWIEVDRFKLMSMLEGGEEHDDYYNGLRERILPIAREMGYPIFLRTDLCSGKHDWTESCYIEDESKLFRNMLRVIEANELAGIFGLDYTAIVLREFLDLKTCFKSHRGMPVSNEWRFFSKKSRIICHHPYWPKDALCFYFKFGSPEPENWGEKFDRFYTEETTDFDSAIKMVEKATGWSDDTWSVDVCQTKDGKWWVTDMALAHQSWHWPDCPHIDEIMEE